MAQHLTGAPIVAASSHRFVWRMADSPPIHPPMKIRLRKTDVKPSRYRLFGQCSKTEQAKARKLYRQGASINRRTSTTTSANSRTVGTPPTFATTTATLTKPSSARLRSSPS